MEWEPCGKKENKDVGGGVRRGKGGRGKIRKQEERGVREEKVEWEQCGKKENKDGGGGERRGKGGRGGKRSSGGGHGVGAVWKKENKNCGGGERRGKG